MMATQVAALVRAVAAVEAGRVNVLIGGRAELRDLRRFLHARFALGERAVLQDEKRGAHQCPRRGVSYDSVVHGCTFMFCVRPISRTRSRVRPSRTPAVRVTRCRSGTSR